MHAGLLGFVVVQSLTDFGGDLGGSPWGLLSLVAAACQIHHSRAAVRGERAAAWPATLTSLVGTVVAMGLLGVPGTVGWFLVGASSVMLLPGRYPFAWLLPALVVQLVLGLAETADMGAAFLAWFAVYTPTVFLLGAGGLVVHAQLAVELDRLARVRAELAEVAVQRERLRVSRDLHDLLGQSLSAVVLKGELAGRLRDVDPERATRETEDLATIARSALADLRATTVDLRAVRLDAEVAGAVRLLDAAGVVVHVTGDPDGLPTDQDALLGWAVREGVTNVLRHSDATACAIVFDRSPGRLTMTIENDAPAGPGGDGSGLDGLASRVRELGGTLRVEHEARRFRLHVDVPVPSARVGHPS
ncbi:sensor histidine kinase [Pseudonocardia sp. Ae505_Ps2]|nr:sensor histidine kinase [Pseudonocardia sp. Ae331_Ps2]OLM13525.1 sensor histidine kinase [Pseudonocardia sp. Ae505_Ps2]